MTSVGVGVHIGLGRPQHSPRDPIWPVCPTEFSPQQKTLPFARVTQVKLSPAVMSTSWLRSIVTRSLLGRAAWGPVGNASSRQATDAMMAVANAKESRARMTDFSEK